MNLAHYLIVTVGYPPEPVEFAINEHNPDGVIFVTSLGSRNTVKALEPVLLGRHSKTLVIEDHENWDEAYQAALEAFEIALRWAGGRGLQITADLTGGTKIMTAGLALCLSSRGIRFSYVGGKREERTGRVITGSEYLRVFHDPEETFAVREREALKDAWNTCRFELAERLLSGYAYKRGAGQSFIEACHNVFKALSLWDRFQYAAAQNLLETSLDTATLDLDLLELPDLAVLFGQLASVAPQQLAALTQAQPSLALIQDLLANAQRRATAERYDDAFIRYERALYLTFRARLLQRVQGRGSGANPATVFARDYKEGRLSTLLERHKNSMLLGGLKSVVQTDYEELESYVLGEYERGGLYPAEAWPRWPEFS